MPKITHIIEEREAGRTVKSIALKEMRLSRSRFSSLKFSWGLRLDGEPARANCIVRPGQVLTAEWDEGGTAPETSFMGFSQPLSIPWQDENYFIICKPAPLPTLSSARQEGPTLENMLYAHLGRPDGYVFRPVNRLDKGTSGLLAVARNGHAQQLLQRQLHSPAFVREYLAVCAGHLPEQEGAVDFPIAKAGEGPKREIRPDGLPSLTRYRVEKETEQYSLVRLRLETGRTHQIRVHMAALGCPIAGDYLYGSADPRLYGRFALHSCLIQFDHPFTGERVRVASPLPRSLALLMEAGLSGPETPNLI